MGSVGTFECAHTEGSVDALGQDGPINAPKKKQRRRTIKERRDIVEETLVPGASVARVARRHEVNANQVFYWRKLYREGQLGITIATPLLPVKVKTERPTRTVEESGPLLSSGTTAGRSPPRFSWVAPSSPSPAEAVWQW